MAPIAMGGGADLWLGALLPPLKKYWMLLESWDENLVITCFLSKSAYLIIWLTNFFLQLAPFGDPYPFTGPQDRDARTAPNVNGSALEYLHL